MVRKDGRKRWFVSTGTVALFAAATLWAFVAAGQARAAGEAPKFTAEQELPFVGDYEGQLKHRNGKKSPLVAQVIALGKGRFCVNLYSEFDKRVATSATLVGRLSDDASKLDLFGWGDISDYCGPDWEGAIEGDTLKGTVSSRHGGPFELKKVVRLSPTLGAKPPEGAVVLFDGGDLDKWQIRSRGKKIVDVVKKREGDAMIMHGGPSKTNGTIRTRDAFQYFKLHVEFRTPFLPEGREQGRGNSGVFAANREVQVLDTYGLGGRSKECGGIYARLAPKVNMCAPPMQWQTYDVTVHKPGKGENAWMSVVHNGVEVLERVDLGTDPKPAPIQLQDHGNTVAYRNIWLVETP